MSGYNGAAYLQYHAGRRTGAIPPPDNTQPRTVCRCCGLLMTVGWYQDIYGENPPGVFRYVDPTDEPWFWRDERSTR